MTYGALRVEIARLFPGVSLNIIDGFAWDRFQDVLTLLDWERTKAKGAFATPAKYATGTVAVTNGSTTVVGTGTTWTAAMTNRMMRVNAEDEFYNFTFTDATHGELDRPYSRASASGLTYRIDQAVYSFPLGIRDVSSIESPGYGPLEKLPATSFSSSRGGYGTPSCWAAYMDSAAATPLLQVELSPVPDRVLTLNYWYEYDLLNPTGATTNQLPPWLNNSCLKYGIMSDLYAIQSDVGLAEHWEAKFQGAVTQMVAQNARIHGGRRLRSATRFTAHRRLRYCNY